jgi:hypothetical protein
MAAPRRAVGLVTHAQMVAMLASAIEDPPRATRVLETAAIRAGNVGEREKAVEQAASH